MTTAAPLTHWAFPSGVEQQQLAVSLEQQLSLQHWRIFTDKVKNRDHHVASGLEEVARAHEHNSIAIVFLTEGRFPQVEALVPRMKAAGFGCHVIGPMHPLAAEMGRLGLAAILHK